MTDTWMWFVCMTAGIPNLITADMIKEGAAVIDVGINRIFDPLTGKDKLVGDVDFEGKEQEIPEISNNNRMLDLFVYFFLKSTTVFY